MSPRRELHDLRKRLAFQAGLDALLESASQRQLSLDATLGECLPVLKGALGAREAWLETLDEDLEPRLFGADEASVAGLVARARELVTGREDVGEGTLFARRLDVAGESYGTIAALCDADEEEAAEREALLHVAAEQLDNFLAAVRQARIKQRLLRNIHKALRQPIIQDGIRQAVDAIDDSVRFDLLIVLFHMEEDYLHTLNYLVFRGPELEFDSQAKVAAELDRVLLGRGQRTAPNATLIVTNAEVEHRKVVGESVQDLATEQETELLLRNLGYHECLETVLISGIQAGHVVGKLVVGSKRPLSTFERDVFDLFADVVQKRIVDYNRAGKLLQRTFATPVVLRLLEEEDPMARLAPRAAEISILYADIVSFTRLSEQILGDPVQVGALIEAWSRGVTRILWKHGGVFDKLVGDCVIGLFGPPYYEVSASERATAICVIAASARVTPRHAVRAAW